MLRPIFFRQQLAPAILSDYLRCSMAQLQATKTVYKVSQFLNWQRSGILDLKPVFQRREVWSPKLKSLLIDTVATGMPMPIIFLREKQDMENLEIIMEVIDGQQRLRTLLSFIEPKCLPDFERNKDAFVVRPSHNRDIANKPFPKLPKDVRQAILGYEISTHVFPATTGDDVVLRMFARINSTGAKLTPQEIRNATYYGEFKTLSYDLAFENLERWRSWDTFSDKNIARMVEVESVSDYLLAMMRGIEAKTQPGLEKAYKDYDDQLKGSDNLRRMFQRVMDAIDDAFGNILKKTRFTRPVLFYSLFTTVYDYMFDMSIGYPKRRKPRKLPSNAVKRLMTLDQTIRTKSLPEEVQDAMDRATTDATRRRVRHNFIARKLGLG